jgi:hypothetical protein
MVCEGGCEGVGADGVLKMKFEIWEKFLRAFQSRRHTHLLIFGLFR